MEWFNGILKGHQIQIASKANLELQFMQKVAEKAMSD
jgi:hypothetical protein